MDIGQDRRLASIGWNIWRGIVGVFYLASAVFNAIYALPRNDELDGYDEGAWFGFLETFMRDVFIPNGELFMALVVAFEIIVGVLILSRGRPVDGAPADAPCNPALCPRKS